MSSDEGEVEGMLSSGQTAATMAVSDIDRARKFYAETLGFSVMRESPGGILFQSGKDTVFFVYPSGFAGTNKATAMSINVGDFDATIADLRDRGVSFMDYDNPEFKTEDGVAKTPEGPAAWFADPDGNVIAVTQMETSQG
jgi:catechol 2,3-dioxygenase-like lactoylglutathione lyase family enzyme